MNWKHRIECIARFERMYNNNEITLFELAEKIYKWFKMKGFIYNDETGDDRKDFNWIDDYGLDKLEDIVDSFHTIAYAKDIFDNESEYPTVEDYDYIKADLYDWADENRVWIEPTGA